MKGTMMKRWVALVALMVSLAATAACGGGEDDDDGEEEDDYASVMIR